MQQRQCRGSSRPRSDMLPLMIAALASSLVRPAFATYSGPLSNSMSTSSEFSGYLSSYSYPAPFCIDLNNDGLVDCIIGTGSASSTGFFPNTGSTTAPTFASSTTETCSSSTVYSDTACLDFLSTTKTYVTPWCGVNFANSGGLVDCIYGTYGGKVLLKVNSGDASTPSFSGSPDDTDLFTWNSIKASGDSYSAPFCADLDNDSDDDCLIGTQYGYVIYCENEGSSGSPSFSASGCDDGQSIFGTAPCGTIDDSTSYYTKPSCADFDNDGDYDCIVGCNDGTTRKCYYPILIKSGAFFPTVPLSMPFSCMFSHLSHLLHRLL